ncbi:MAG: 3-phosphoglycerate dehydrogenase [Deltaproteobacteria bacterium]|nr:3-phosphoglycerate dehydrogenase [Deltaproteobacteria bacterium]MCZ6624662.1 NAD(P)-dependent oxidoreductase [Deltaproteobacteria bacterium]
MESAKIFIFAPADTEGTTHKKMEERSCELVLGEASWDTPQGNNEAEMARMARGADALIGTSIRSSPISKKIMQSSDKLRIVAKYTIGVDDVDVEAATEMGILVTHCPTESNWGGVAEGTVGAMLTLLKKSRERDRHLKEGARWRDMRLQGSYVGSRADGYQGITIGLIGIGRVGGRVATLMRPWNARILACDPYVPDSRFEELGVKKVDLNSLLRESDVVSLHVVLTKETRHMIGAEQLAMMKPTAILINTSRGFCVDEGALVEALRNDKIAAAALDVFAYEPLALESPLRILGDKVLLSPHMISSNVGSGLKPGILWATESVFKALQGEVPDNVYNKEVISQWERRYGGKSVWKREGQK